MKSKSLFERAMEALPDGVLLIDAERRVLFSNRAFSELWRVPAELLATGDDALLLKFAAGQLVDPLEFLRSVEVLHASSAPSEDEIHFEDGQILARRSVPFEQDGAFKARIWIFTDVTEARHANIDALTGLPNRRAYTRDFPGYVRSPADGFLRTVAIMDVDNFKSYNDRYGHDAGDAVLSQIGVILHSHLRSADDLLFRVGGEEFVMAVRTRNEIAAHAIFEAIRQSIAALAIPHVGNAPHGIVTASFGVGSFSAAKAPSAVFKNVDAAMYQAKAKGRNGIVSTFL